MHIPLVTMLRCKVIVSPLSGISLRYSPAFRFRTMSTSDTSERLELPDKESTGTVEDNLTTGQDQLLVNTRGRKIKPSKDTFVVLDPRQAGLLKKRHVPDHFKNDDNRNLSILEGVELGIDRNVSRRKGMATSARSIYESNEILREIEFSRKKLLVFESSVSKEQVVKSIGFQNPTIKIMSQQRYDQLVSVLDSAYTAPQLRAYTKTVYGNAHTHWTKNKVISILLNDYWGCSVNTVIKETDDLIVEKIIDISTRDMYLLLLTNHGKILHNLARIGATLAVALDENKIIVRATSSIIRYVEVSLTKILQNVHNEILPISDIISRHTARGAKLMTYKDKSELISLIQKENGSFFEKSLSDDDCSGEYVVSAFGNKRVNEAKKLLLWGIKYNPQLVERLEYCGNADLKYKRYPFTRFECLDWINRNKQWYREQTVVSTKSIVSNRDDQSQLVINDEKLNSYYNFLKSDLSKDTKTNMVELDSNYIPVKTVSITLGQLLRSDDAINLNSHLFEPKVPLITNKLLRLPLYNDVATKDELYTIDQHDYYVQLKFVPDLSCLSNTSLNLPPLELWLELDEHDNAVISSAQCILQMEQRRLLLETRHRSHDYRFDNDTIIELTESFEDNQETWLDNQPGIKDFLKVSKLSFGSNNKVSLPTNITVKLPIINGEGTVENVNVSYNFINTTYQRVLRLKYLGKYMVQFSDVNCGSRGGRYTQVDFVGEGTEFENPKNFSKFLNDVTKFF